jgi:hypothetical protein
MLTIDSVRIMLIEIDSASDSATLGRLYAFIVGYNPFESSDDLDDLDDVRMTLTDYVKEMACAAGIHWLDVVGGAA